jgi:hypothetical protein
MTALADAAALVRSARRRLVGAARLSAALSGLTAGAFVSICAWGVLVATDVPPPVVVLVAVPLLFAALHAAGDRSTRISTERAALTLDRAAGTQEAFVSALTAEDAPVEFRELAARQALVRCSRGSLPRVLPIDVPRAAPRAALAAALLVALLVVPRAGAATRPILEAGGGVDGAGTITTPGRGPTVAVDPSERARALVAAMTAKAAGAAASSAALRRDLPALDAQDLGDLARTLAEGDLGERSAAAREALAALANGDLAGAERALDRALGGPPKGTGTEAGGTGTGTPTDAVSRGQAGAWSAPTWPLRYDRTVRQWFEAQNGSSGSGTGGNR